MLFSFLNLRKMLKKSQKVTHSRYLIGFLNLENATVQPNALDCTVASQYFILIVKILSLLSRLCAVLGSSTSSPSSFQSKQTQTIHNDFPCFFFVPKQIDFTQGLPLLLLLLRSTSNAQTRNAQAALVDHSKSCFNRFHNKADFIALVDQKSRFHSKLISMINTQQKSIFPDFPINTQISQISQIFRFVKLRFGNKTGI